MITFIQYILVSLFFCTFSIFTRAALSGSYDGDIAKPANAFEITYIVSLWLTIMFSTTVRIEWIEAGFWIISMFMGILSMIMVIFSIIYVASLDVIFKIAFAFYILLILIPIVLNINRIKICDFIKGSIYAIYLSPTYINILTIYAISNIHDVSWGSRPDSKDKGPNSRFEKFEKLEKRREIEYKNYRSNFLIIWCLVNTLVSIAVLYSINNDYLYFVHALAIFLLFVTTFKLVCSAMFMILNWLKS